MIISSDQAGDKQDTEKDKTGVSLRIRRRRRRVLELMLIGTTQADMAEMLGVSTGTIYNDVRALKEEMEASVTRFNPEWHVASTIREYEEVAAAAWRSFLDSDAELAKNQFLKTVLSANKNKLDLLMDVGIVPKQGIKIDAEINLNAGPLQNLPEDVRSKLDDPNNRQRALATAQQLLRLGLADELKDADVDILEEDTSE